MKPYHLLSIDDEGYTAKLQNILSRKMKTAQTNRSRITAPAGGRQHHLTQATANQPERTMRSPAWITKQRHTQTEVVFELL